MSEHRVSMLGGSWRRLEDPTRSRDPRVLAVVGALATLPAPSPRPEFRAELRAQLVAITPRLVAEGTGVETPMVDIVPRPKPTPRVVEPVGRRPRAVRARHADGVFAHVRAIPIGRPLSVAASVVVAFALMLGGAVWMSQRALPGDALYGLKRASEGFELATAGSNTAKAKDYLDFATTRADEVRSLLGRAQTTAAGPGLGADGAVSASTARLISSTLGSADSDVKSATSLLSTQAVRSSSSTPLNDLTTWAPGQLQRLRQIAAAMPDTSLRKRTMSSAHLVDAAVTRAGQLKPKLGCTCLNSAPTDDLGPVPCTACTASPTLPSGPTHNGGHHAVTSSKAPKAAKQHTNGGSDPAQVTGPGAAKPSGAHPAASTSSPPNKHITLPTLPPLLPTSPPVSVNSCGAAVTLPIIGIQIGLCSGVHVSVHP